MTLTVVSLIYCESDLRTVTSSSPSRAVKAKRHQAGTAILRAHNHNILYFDTVSTRHNATRQMMQFCEHNEHKSTTVCISRAQRVQEHNSLHFKSTTSTRAQQFALRNGADKGKSHLSDTTFLKLPGTLSRCFFQ